METVILVSVLSTLGAVAVLASIVVVFVKLRNKVDVNEFASRIDELERAMIDNNKFLEGVINQNEENTHRLFDEINRKTDSRLDKLNSKITNMPERQLLND